MNGVRLKEKGKKSKNKINEKKNIREKLIDFLFSLQLFV